MSYTTRQKIKKIIMKIGTIYKMNIKEDNSPVKPLSVDEFKDNYWDK